MLRQYLTIKHYDSTEVEINKSRFIAYVTRAETEEQAVAFIDQIKKKHWDATHNCSAYVVGENDQHQKADDDGEPSGTAGKPILEVIKRSNLKDAVIVVTRYFGGIKLGAGGLIRAYGKSASAGIKAAGILQRTLHTRVVAEIDYTFLGKLENELRTQDYPIEQISYADRVAISALAEKGFEHVLEAQLLEWTAGQVCITQDGETYVDVDVEF